MDEICGGGNFTAISKRAQRLLEGYGLKWILQHLARFLSELCTGLSVLITSDPKSRS